jgi:hypothetical protein
MIVLVVQDRRPSQPVPAPGRPLTRCRHEQISGQAGGAVPSSKFASCQLDLPCGLSQPRGGAPFPFAHHHRRTIVHAGQYRHQPPRLGWLVAPCTEQPGRVHHRELGEPFTQHLLGHRVAAGSLLRRADQNVGGEITTKQRLVNRRGGLGIPSSQLRETAP